MKRIIVDLDGTITIHAKGGYANAVPNTKLISKLKEYKALGFEIVVHTSRNMNTHGGNIGKINAQTLPIALDWLQRHDVPFDEIHVGKPWCGHEGFYIDDRAIRPSEFERLSVEEITALIAAEQK